MLSAEERRLDRKAFQQLLHETRKGRMLEFAHVLAEDWKRKRIQLMIVIDERPCFLFNPRYPHLSHCDQVYRIDDSNADLYMTPNRFGIMPPWHLCPGHAKDSCDASERGLCEWAATDWRGDDAHQKEVLIEEVTRTQVDAVLREKDAVQSLIREIEKFQEASLTHKSNMQYKSYRKYYKKRQRQMEMDEQSAALKKALQTRCVVM